MEAKVYWGSMCDDCSYTSTAHKGRDAVLHQIGPLAVVWQIGLKQCLAS